jgi:hypothetical protein
MIKILDLYNRLYMEMDAAHASKIFLTTYKSKRRYKTEELNITLLTFHSSLSCLFCVSLKFSFSV